VASGIRTHEGQIQSPATLDAFPRHQFYTSVFLAQPVYESYDLGRRLEVVHQPGLCHGEGNPDCSISPCEAAACAADPESSRRLVLRHTGTPIAYPSPQRVCIPKTSLVPLVETDVAVRDACHGVDQPLAAPVNGHL
jgi:hypothetical protein